MKTVVELSLALLIATAAFIAMCSFVSWGFDPASWTQAARAPLLCLWIMLVLGSYVLVEAIKKENRDAHRN